LEVATRSVASGQRHEFEVAISEGQPQQRIEDLAKEQGAIRKGIACFKRIPALFGGRKLMIKCSQAYLSLHCGDL